jgi:thiol-disulfide isomerase/thioredoxin
MKKLLSLLSVLIILASCSKESKADYVLFSGKITNPNGSKVRISGNDFKKTIKMKDGVFADTLNIPKNGYYTFSDGRENTAMYLKKGAKVNVTLDTKEFDETITYTGSDESNFLAKKYMMLENSGLDGKDLTSTPSNKLVEKATKLKTSISDLLKTFKVSESFKKDANIDIDYLVPTTIAKFLAYQGYFYGNKVEGADELLKEFDALNINYDNEADFNASDNYKTLIDVDFMRKSAKTEDNGFAIIKAKKSKTIKNRLLRQVAYQINPGNENLEKDYNALMEIAADQKYKDEITAKYKKYKNLVPGTVSPVFENYENFKGGTTSLADLKGKYVYIDVWATWCAPCKREIPFLQKIEEKYHGKNIAFVSLSIDKADAHEAWKTMVTEKEMSGIQLFAPSDWSSKFVQDYGIEGIPTFIMIDPEGKIVSASAPRPSSPKLTMLIDSLLAKK